MLKGNIGSFSTLFGWTILHEAVSSESFEMLLFLLQFGNCRAYTKTSCGYTPMHIAVYEKKQELHRLPGGLFVGSHVLLFEESVLALSGSLIEKDKN